MGKSQWLLKENETELKMDTLWLDSDGRKGGKAER